MIQPPPTLSDFSEADKERFWSRVKTAGPDECWHWQAGRKDRNHGYGSFRLRNMFRPEGAHRIAYMLSKGSPVGFVIRHDCNVESCCNPKHLLPGSAQDNVNDKTKSGRFRGRNGAEFISDEEFEKLASLIKERGVYRPKVAELMGWSMQRLNRAIRVLRNLRGMGQNWRLRDALGDETLLEILDKCNKKEFSQDEIAAQYGIKRGSMRNTLKRFRRAAREGKPPFFYFDPPRENGKSRIRNPQ